MDNKENFYQVFIRSTKFSLKEFNDLKEKESNKLVDWAIQCVGSYYHDLDYINQYQLKDHSEIKTLCNQFEETILNFIKNHLKESKVVDQYTQQLFERSYRIAVAIAGNKNEKRWELIDAPDFDFDLFDLNGFHYYLRVFKELGCYKELEWDKKEKEFWSHEENFKKAILGYTKGWYDDNATPWFPDHLDWWPKEFWWNDVMAYGAVVYRGKKFQDVVLYPENLDKVEILKLK